MLQPPRPKPATLVVSLILIMGSLGLGGSPLAEAAVGDEPPEVRIINPLPFAIVSEDKVTFEWVGSDPEGDALTYTARYSADRGNSWTTLISDTTSTALIVSRSRLAASPTARFEVTVSDGVSTGRSEVSPFFVTNNRPRVVVQQPANGAAFSQEEMVDLVGRAADTEDGSLDGDSLTWTSDRDGDLGSGSSVEVLASNLAEGEHLVTLTAEDGDGERVSVSRTIVILEPEPAPPSSITTTTTTTTSPTPTTGTVTTSPVTTSPVTTSPVETSTADTATTTSSVEPTTATTATGTVDSAATTAGPTTTEVNPPDGEPMPLRVKARGDTGEEQAEVRVDDEVIAAFAVTTEWADFVYELPADTTLEAIKVAFVNDAVQPTLSGRLRDRNLHVDHIEFDGTVHESEAQTTLAHGTWSRRNGCGPGNKQSEVLHCDGHFQYASLTPPSVPDPPKSPTSLVVRIKGDTGEEYGEVRIAGQVFATFAATTDWQKFAYELPAGTLLDDIEVAFINDVVLRTLSGRDRDRNLHVDYIDFGGVRHESEFETTLSTGTWTRSNGCGPGIKRMQVLHCNGAFRYTN